ncbi:trehalase family glycosidase [Shigella flexneri]
MLVPLPEPYVVPGGRFREVHFWDMYSPRSDLPKRSLG